MSFFKPETYALVTEHEDGSFSVAWEESEESGIHPVLGDEEDIEAMFWHFFLDEYPRCEVDMSERGMNTEFANELGDNMTPASWNTFVTPAHKTGDTLYFPDQECKIKTINLAEWRKAIVY